MNLSACSKRSLTARLTSLRTHAGSSGRFLVSALLLLPLLTTRSALADVVYSINATFAPDSSAPAGNLLLTGTYTLPAYTGELFGDPVLSYDLLATVHGSSVEFTAANSVGTFVHTFEDDMGGDGLGFYNDNYDQIGLYFASGFSGVGQILPSILGSGAYEEDSQVILNGNQVYNLISGSSFVNIVLPGGGDKIVQPDDPPPTLVETPEPDSAGLLGVGLLATLGLTCRRGLTPWTQHRPRSLRRFFDRRRSR